MTGVLGLLEEAVLAVALVRVAAGVLGVGSWRDRRPPWPAALLLLLVGVPSVVQLGRPSLLASWDADASAIVDGHEYWRLVTSMTVQDPGVAGLLVNLVLLSLVGALAVWFWGGPRAVALLVVLGAGLNLLGAVSDATSAGSSGATYALGATILGHTLLTPGAIDATAVEVAANPTRTRLTVLAVLLLGGALWAIGNHHGLAVVAGAGLGALLALVG